MRKRSRLTLELEEMGHALHRLGALSDNEYAKITMRDMALDKIDDAGPQSPREIGAIRKAPA